MLAARRIRSLLALVAGLGVVAGVLLAGTPSARAATPIQVAYESSGGVSGPLGHPSRPEECGLRNGGCKQQFTYGYIYWSPATGAHRVLNHVIGPYWDLASDSSELGYPTSDENCRLGTEGCGQDFERGSVYWSPDTGSIATFGVIRSYWLGAGGPAGSLGYPSGWMSCDPRGCTQGFRGGVVAWSPTAGIRVVPHYPIFEGWANAGGSTGPLGYPTTAMGCGMVRGGCGQQFEGGSVYHSPATGPHGVSGRIWGVWIRNGWERGPLGYPSWSMLCGRTGGGCTQAFEGGTVTWSPASGAQFTNGAIGRAWTAQGAETGTLGYPTTAMACGMVRSGCGQQFQGGSVYWTPATGAHPVTGHIWNVWIANGWERGPLGYAAADARCGLTGGGCRQTFTGGTATWSPATGAHFTNGPIGAAWTAAGSEAGALSYPSLPMGCGLVRNGCGQQFQNGSVYWTPTAGAHAVSGPIWHYWMAAGWERGPLGYASSDLDCTATGGGCKQHFTGGSVYSTGTTGTHATYGVIRSYWLARDAEQGALGYPTGEMTCGAVACSQAFQGGVLEWTQATGVRVR